MTNTKNKAKQLLRDSGLRTTAPRLAVLGQLLRADGPLSHSEVLNRMGETDWDPATIYRNLVKLRKAGLAVIASRAEGIDRYALAGKREDEHRHPHFLCDDCGKLACLPVEITLSKGVKDAWTSSIANAMIQLRGECPDCVQPENQR